MLESHIVKALMIKMLGGNSKTGLCISETLLLKST